MAKLKLDSEPEPEVLLIAISSHVNDYRLCWALNRSLGIDLCRRKKDIEDQGPEQKAFYPAFDHDGENHRDRISLISNHSPQGVLLAEQRQADYFLVVDDDDPDQAAGMLQRVRGTEFVLTAFFLDIKALKGAYKLLQ